MGDHVKRSFVLIASLLLVSSAAVARSSGNIDGSSGLQGGNLCMECHSIAGAYSPTLSIEGPDTVAAGSVNTSASTRRSAPGP
jgi:hypothetical protein